MVAAKTYAEYIKKCDEVIASGNNKDAYSLTTEIVTCLQSDLPRLSSGLDAYPPCASETPGNYIKDLHKLRARLQKELDAIEPGVTKMDNVRSEIFISHRSLNTNVADMIKDFLVATGIPNEKVFCSSLPGNDVNERISPEVKDHLKRASIIILILSHDFYESAYCLNEAGVAWYLEEVRVIPIGLPEINESSMIGFLNDNYKLRRIDNDDDISYIYDQAQEILHTSQVKHSIITRETHRLKEKYLNYVCTRMDGEEAATHDEQEIASVQTSNHNADSYPPIQLHASVMLFYAAEENGEIIISSTLSGTFYSAGKTSLNTSNEPRELAKWESAVEQLQSSGYIKRIGIKDRIYKVTEKGYIISDSFKEANNLDSSMSLEQVLAMFEDE